MVRYKKRYFVIQLDRATDIENRQSSSRAHIDPSPLFIPNDVLAQSIKDVVQDLHGDFGRAAITTGLRTIYCNPQTRLILIQCRHGPHRFVASSLPFMTKIKDERIVPRLIYTGATILSCYKKMEAFQRQQLDLALRECQHSEAEKQAIMQKLALKQMKH